MACVGNQLSLEHGTGDPGRNEYCTSYIQIYHRFPHSHYGGDSTLHRTRLKRLCFFYCFGRAWVGQPNIFNSPFITNLAIKGRRRALCKSKQSSKSEFQTIPNHCFRNICSCDHHSVSCPTRVQFANSKFQSHPLKFIPVQLNRAPCDAYKFRFWPRTIKLCLCHLIF